MKNLINLPLEDLDKIPARQSMRWELMPTASVIRRKPYRNYPYSNRAWQQLSNRVDRIIKGSVGQHWDSIYSRIVKIVGRPRYDYDLPHNIQWYVSLPIWSCRNQRWECRSQYYRYGRNVDLYDHIRHIKQTTHISPRRQEEFYYVCPVTKTLKVARSRPYRKETSTEFWRRHYKFITDRKRKYKEHRQQNNDMLKLINDPELYKFYISIVQEYRLMLGEKQRLQEKYDGYALDKSDYRGKELYAKWAGRELDKYYRNEPAHKAKIESLKNQIEELEAGNFDGFFESNVYLYSRQKECHHYETP